MGRREGAALGMRAGSESHEIGVVRAAIVLCGLERRYATLSDADDPAAAAHLVGEMDRDESRRSRDAITPLARPD